MQDTPSLQQSVGKRLGGTSVFLKPGVRMEKKNTFKMLTQNYTAKYSVAEMTGATSTAGKDAE